MSLESQIADLVSAANGLITVFSAKKSSIDAAVAAAIANAIASATGRRIRENPASLEQVLLGKKLR